MTTTTTARSDRTIYKDDGNDGQTRIENNPVDEANANENDNGDDEL